MNIYSKPTDSKRYVSYLSNHPKPCTKNTLFCLARRICVKVENKNVRRMRLKELRAILKNQKYPKMLLKRELKKLSQLPRSNLEVKKSTYNPNNPKVFPKVRVIYGNLQTSKTLGKICAKHKLIVYKRQPSNLKRLQTFQTFFKIFNKQTNFQNNKMRKKLLLLGLYYRG